MLRVLRGNASQFLWIREGKAGSYQTAAQMAKLVREAASNDPALEKFAAQILINSRLDSHSNPDEIIDAIFRYVQAIPYISDTTGQGSFDAVQSARDTIADGKGDCDDLSVLLATLLALVGLRPVFVLAKMREDSKGFDHVYVAVPGRKGRTALDPTSRKYGMGWESPLALERATFPIFGNSRAGARGLSLDVDWNALIQQGAQAGLQQGAKAAAAAKKSPQALAAGRSFDQLDKSLAKFLLTLNEKATAGTLTIDDFELAQNGVAALEIAAGRDAQADNTGYVRRQWAAEATRYTSWLQALAAHVQNPNPAIGSAPVVSGTSSPVISGDFTGGTSGTVGNSSALGSVLPVQLPTVLLFIGAFFVLRTIMQKR